MTDPKRWPAYCRGPNGESELFASPDDLPKGWYHPRLEKPVEKPATKTVAKKDAPLDL